MGNVRAELYGAVIQNGEYHDVTKEQVLDYYNS